MGKAKKLKISKAPRNTPLEENITKDEFAAPSGRVKVRKDRKDEDTTDAFIDGKLSKQIINQARLQMQDLQTESGEPTEKSEKKSVKLPKFGENLSGDEEDDYSDGEDDGEADEQKGFNDEVKRNYKMNKKDEEAFEAFMNNSGPRRTLADIIQEKLTEKRTEIDTQYTDAESLQQRELDPRVVEMYQEVGEILAKYRSGKVPKAFKVIAQFRNWEDLLILTKPENWSAAAVYQATRIFTANLKEKFAQRFFNQLLLPRVRDDIDEYQRLNYHLYQALRKALFKPGAFFKGFLLPLLESGNCTLREAIIVGSVIGRNSIPILHSSAVMLKIAEMEYGGSNSIFLRIFFDKKYALPYRVVDAVVFHFLKFRGETRFLPVLWHQAFLTFVQRYKGHISTEQKEALLELLKVQFHDKITPEIRRELQHAKCRDEEIEEPML